MGIAVTFSFKLKTKHLKNSYGQVQQLQFTVYNAYVAINSLLEYKSIVI